MSWCRCIARTVVPDNLNTHTLASLYEAFEPGEARRVAAKLELVHAQARQLAERGGDRTQRAQPAVSGSADAGPCHVTREAQAWEQHRNETANTIDWRFTTEEARIKLKSLYPKTQA